MDTLNTRIPFGWNASAPLLASTSTDDLRSVLTLTDVNGAGIVIVELTIDGQMNVTSLIGDPE